MKIVTYGADRFLTSDEASDALLAFAATIGARGGADVVSVPARELDGTPHTVDLVIGPASELLARDIEVVFTAPDTAAMVAELHARMTRLASPPNLSVAQPLQVVSSHESAERDAAITSLEDIHSTGIDDLA